MITITILSDNCVAKPHLKAEWGFSVLVSTPHRGILFDTGADSSLLMSNIKELGIKKGAIDAIFISHDHWDHVGGLKEASKRFKVPVLVPKGGTKLSNDAQLTAEVSNSIEIFPGIFSTGTLENNEQSLVLKTNSGSVVIAGCSHSGVDKILKAANKVAKPYALIGGLHDFKKYSVLRDMKYICPTHCTQNKQAIYQKYKKEYIEGGVGRVIKIK